MREKISELLRTMRMVGWGPGTEPYEVCRRAVQCLGRPYTRTEELAVSTIDCSTLTSQSYWEGAQIGIPFIADNQRIARSGVCVASVGEARPSDVFVRYRAVEDAPDRTYNHVGLYLGRDCAGRGWLVEARGGVGVVLTKIEDFPPLGGIRRFALDWHTSYLSCEARSAGDLARLVPKLGRPAARQYLVAGSERPVHRGLDIYLEPGTEVISPLDGYVERFFDEREGAAGVEIHSTELLNVVARLVHVEMAPSPVNSVYFLLKYYLLLR